jgi:ferritin-like metal-binding protein YciE
MTTNSGNKTPLKSTMQPSQLMKLFEDELKDIYWAEKALTKGIPKMIENASSEELVAALTNHLKETELHVDRLEKVFESYGQKAEAEKCEAMEGLLAEAEEMMEECESGVMCDAGIISVAQKIEHYEIASYGTLRQFAETLGLIEAAALLQDTLEEEKNTDKILTQVAINTINVEAAEEEV